MFRRRSTMMALLGIVLLRAGAVGAAAGDDRLTNLVAGRSKLFALRGNTVVTFDRARNEISRCARFEAPPARSQPPPGGPIDAQEVLRTAGLPDDDFQSAEAEEVLAAEGLAPRRRRAVTAEAPILARTLAASGSSDDVWIATTGGLYRGRDGACTRAALPGRDVVAVAAAGDAIAVATADLLWRSTDGGGTFRVAAGLTARPRALAIVDVARTLVASDDGIIEIGPYGTVRTLLERGSDALAVCGGIALAFADGGAWTWTGDRAPERAGARPPARTLACGQRDAARFIAAGDRLFMSADGTAWREVGIASETTAMDGRIWLAAGKDIVPLEGVPAAARAPVGAASVGAATRAPAPAPPRTGGLLEPVFPWPQLTIVFSAQRTPLREGWSLVALVVFRLGRGGAARADGRRLAAEIVRRDAELAAQEIELLTAPDNDPSRAARLRALRQEREALR